jgi:hypothetical protein
MKVGKNIHAINEVKQYGPKEPQFIFFGGGWVLDFLLFPMCLQHVPQVDNVFPNMFPIALPFIPNPYPKFYSCNIYK